MGCQCGKGLFFKGVLLQTNRVESEIRDTQKILNTALEVAEGKTAYNNGYNRIIQITFYWSHTQR